MIQIVYRWRYLLLGVDPVAGVNGQLKLTHPLG